MKKWTSALLTLTGALCCALPSFAADMKTWVEPKSGFSVQYPDFFASSFQNSDKNGASIYLRSGDDKIGFLVEVINYNKNQPPFTVQNALERMKRGSDSQPGSEYRNGDRFGFRQVSPADNYQCFQHALLTPDRAFFIMLEGPLDESDFTPELLDAVRDSMKVGGGKSDAIPMNAEQRNGHNHYQVTGDLDYFNRHDDNGNLLMEIATSPVLGDMAQKWSWFVVTPETAYATEKDYGLWLATKGGFMNNIVMIPMDNPDAVQSVSMSPDGKHFVVMRDNDTLNSDVFETRTLKPVYSFPGDGSLGSAAVWVDNERFAATVVFSETPRGADRFKGEHCAALCDINGNLKILKMGTALSDYWVRGFDPATQEVEVQDFSVKNEQEWDDFEATTIQTLHIALPH